MRLKPSQYRLFVMARIYNIMHSEPERRTKAAGIILAFAGNRTSYLKRIKQIAKYQKAREAED